MSWAEEDWTVGLSGRVLQKVKELQIHHERLSRENKQKQLQLDNIHTSLEKQTVKVWTLILFLTQFTWQITETQVLVTLWFGTVDFPSLVKAVRNHLTLSCFWTGLDFWSQPAGSTQEPCCCETVVLTTAPPSTYYGWCNAAFSKNNMLNID